MKLFRIRGKFAFYLSPVTLCLFTVRSGENDVEYGSNMDLEEGELMEDVAGAAGASGMI